MASATDPQRRTVHRPVTLVVAVWLALLSFANGDQWPQWRGPQGDGTSRERNLPDYWNEQLNVRWKTRIPAWGTSTPAVWNDAIFLTSQDARGQLLLLKVHRDSGRIEWTRVVGAGIARQASRPQRSRQVFHRWHNMASPSPVTDGRTVVALFGNGDLAAYDFAGKRLWSRNLQKEHGRFTTWWGFASSPVIYQDQVIVACMQDSLADLQDEPATSYLASYYVTSGRPRWKQVRMTKATAEQCDAYTTPLLIKVGTRDELVVMGGNQLDGYDPGTGQRLWFLSGLAGGRTVPSPTVAHGLLYAVRGLRGPLLAVRTGKTGQLSRRDIVWTHRQGTPDTCCPVVWKDLLFTISDQGLLRCFDAPRGALKWKRRLKGEYKASPLAADGKIYLLNTDGLCTVVAASPRFDKLTENKLEDAGVASLAVANGRILIRGKETLYCICKAR